MTQRRTLIAAFATLATLTFGLAATGADARSAVKPRVTTSIPTVNTLPICYSGTNCQRTKNAALPTTTIKPPVIPANAASWYITGGIVYVKACKAGFILDKNQCLPAATTTTAAPRVKNGLPKSQPPQPPKGSGGK